MRNGALTKIFELFIATGFFLLLLVAFNYGFSVSSTVPQGIAQQNYVSFLNQRDSNFRKIGVADAEMIGSHLNVKLATFSKIQIQSYGSTQFVGLISNNFFATLGMMDKQLNLQAPNQIVLSANHSELLKQRVAVGEEIRISGKDFIVIAIAPKDFRGISSSGEVGWITHVGNEHLYDGYPQVGKKDRAKLFHFAPRQFAFASVPAETLAQLEKSMQAISRDQVAYMHVDSVFSVRFGLDNFRLVALEGLIYDREAYKKNANRAKWLLFGSFFVAVCVSFGLILSKITETLRQVDNFRLEEMVGAPPSAIFLNLSKLALFPIGPALFLAIILFIVLSTVWSNALFTQRLDWDLFIPALLSTTFVALLQIALITVVNFSLYNHKKNIELNQRYSVSKGELLARRASIMIQSSILAIVIFSLFVGYAETRTFGRSSLGFEPSQFHYLSIEEERKLDVNLNSYLRLAFDNNPDFKPLNITPLLGPPGFGEPWTAEVTTKGNNFEKLTANMTFISPSYIDLVQPRLIAGSYIDDSGAPGIMINRALLKALRSEPDSLINRDLKLNIMGTEVFKPLLGVIDDSRAGHPTVYINNADKRGIRVEGETFILSNVVDLQDTRDKLDRLLRSIGAKVNSLSQMDEVIYQLRPELKYLILTASALAIALFLLMGYSLMVGIYHNVTSRKQELSLKYLIGASPAKLLAEVSLESLMMVGFSVFISLCVFSVTIMYIHQVLSLITLSTLVTLAVMASVISLLVISFAIVAVSIFAIRSIESRGGY